MAELNLKQIEDKLNSEFTGDTRKLVFWYDDKGEFIEDIENLELKNAKVHHLIPTNLFRTKVLLERKDTKSNYLIYAPFPKPNNRENHLADTIKYSKEFSADRASLIAADLGIDENGKKVLQKYIKFFGAKDRMNKFYDLVLDNYNEDSIEIALLSVLTKSKAANFEDVVRIVLTNSKINDLGKNEYIMEFKKYGLDEAFWEHCSNTFSFADESPNLEKLIISLFLTYAQKEVNRELPSSMSKYVLEKSGTVMAFTDQLMNNLLYRDEFDSLSDKVYRKINGEKLFKDYSVEDIVELDIFRFVDEKIINWIIDRLLDENLNAAICNMDIPKLCKFRELKHFGWEYSNEYHVLSHGFYIIKSVNFKPESAIISLIDKYDKDYYKIDTHYRKFYYYLDQVKDVHMFDELQVLVENIYTNKYLDVLSRQFNEKFSYKSVEETYKLQRNFYRNFVSESKERLVVIISDAFRYEVAKEFVKILERDKKFTEVNIKPQIGVLPSYTRLGMASLLPHSKLSIDDDYNVYVDGKPCSNLVERDEILKTADQNAAAIQYDVLKRYKRDEIRAFFTGKSVVYIYHNQIDARGDNPSTEDEAFLSCAEAIEEIENLIKKLTDSVSITKYIVTSDHGFIYKRNKTSEAAKIGSFFSKEDDMVNKRFIVSENNYEVIGTKSMFISDILGSYDTKAVTFPLTSNIFKASGGGQNFVHGGGSPQEILIPVVQIKTIRGYKETQNVKISLISMLPKITSLILNLDFIQQEPISDVVKPTTYSIVFVDEAGEVISNEEIYLADNKEKESAKRIFKLKFSLKNQSYERNKKYYLIATDAETGMEAFRHEVIIDIAFADDFGLDI
jgi:uncharacterized protein (TIGR02687 family)